MHARRQEGCAPRTTTVQGCLDFTFVLIRPPEPNGTDPCSTGPDRTRPDPTRPDPTRPDLT